MSQNVGSTNTKIYQEASAEHEGGIVRVVAVKYGYSGTNPVGQLPALGTQLPTAPVNLQTAFGSVVRFRSASIIFVQENLYEIEEIYRPPGDIASSPGVGTIRQGSSATSREIELTDDEKAALPEGSNKTTKIGVQVIYKREEILSGFSFTESNVVGTTGQLVAPTGLTSPTAGKWLHVDRAIEQVDNGFRLSESWQYDENGWEGQ